jgi:8-oxo-dGTP pyrophosphatase MutT (NUDIX family)
VTGSYPQVIPRPELWALGAPAPWAHLTEAERRGITLERVLRALDVRGLRSLPDRVMAPAKEAKVADAEPHAGAYSQSAVLVALFEELGEVRVILTRRASHLRTHRGEVSFPGGRLDPGERPVDAALREAEEEIGLDPAEVAIVGHLLPIATFVSGAWIEPMVGTLAARPSLAAAPDEVARVFDVALSDLLVDGVFHEELWRRPVSAEPGAVLTSFPLWFFEVSGEMVWGATGRLLMDLLVTVALGEDR